MLQAEITIARPQEVVWGYFTKPENWEKWWGGGLKSAEWRRGGSLTWTSGGSSAIQAITPGSMVQTSGSWVDHTFTLEPRGGGKTIVRIQESSPKGGASFSDGGAAHLASLNSYLKKLKDRIETETEPAAVSEERPASGRNAAAATRTCPHCGFQLEGTALAMIEANVEVGAVDFRITCSSCGRAISKRDVEAASKKSPGTSAPEKATAASPARRWWEFWR